MKVNLNILLFMYIGTVHTVHVYEHIFSYAQVIIENVPL